MYKLDLTVREVLELEKLLVRTVKGVKMNPDKEVLGEVYQKLLASQAQYIKDVEEEFRELNEQFAKDDNAKSMDEWNHERD